MRRTTQAIGQARNGRARDDDRILLFGYHAVAAALANPARPCRRLLVTDNALRRLGALAERPGLALERASAREIMRPLTEGSVHQGCCLEAGPLPEGDLSAVLATIGEQALVLALDQLEDPRNVGAVLRSAAAFGVDAVVVPRHGTAWLNGACAKAASGALDFLPIVTVANLSRALALMKDHGFWTVALDAGAETTLTDLPRFPRCAVIVGGEGRGLRRLTLETCDVAAKLEIDARVESLNVAVATGIALHHLRSRTGVGTT